MTREQIAALVAEAIEGQRMSVKAVSYAEVVDRAARAIRTRCLDYSFSDVEALCSSCAADIAALRALAALVTEAERQKAEIEKGMQPGSNFAGIVADLAAGYTPPLDGPR